VARRERGPGAHELRAQAVGPAREAGAGGWRARGSRSAGARGKRRRAGASVQARRAERAGSSSDAARANARAAGAQERRWQRIQAEQTVGAGAVRARG
jgi:hypothetical protein